MAAHVQDKGKGSPKPGSAPTTEQMRAVVSSILKEVDFNTATVDDFVGQLGTYFEMDLMDRKAEVMRIAFGAVFFKDDEEDSGDEAEHNGEANKK